MGQFKDELDASYKGYSKAKKKYNSQMRLYKKGIIKHKPSKHNILGPAIGRKTAGLRRGMGSKRGSMS